MTAARETLGVGISGFGWMGRVHTQAYTRVLHHFPALTIRPQLIAIADEVVDRGAAAAAQYGFGRATADWRDLVTDPLVQAASITAPNFLHREMGTTFARAGKHIWIEKPVGLTADDARAVAGAVRAAGVQATVGFNYRNPPAVEAARQLIASGELGTISHARFRMLSDYAAHPEGALSWRYELGRAGHGVFGDLATHAVDLAIHLLGDITSVIADSAIFVKERAKPDAATSGHSRAAGGDMGPVENEDYGSSLIRFASGAHATLDVSRVAVGEQNSYGFEIYGSHGFVSWDFRRMGELRVSVGTDYQDQPVSTIYVGPGDGDYAAFQPGSAISMGYDDLKVIEASHFLESIASGKPVGATIEDAVRAAVVLDAMGESVSAGAWTRVDY
jgi:predicted dehydrogenase